MRRCVPALNMFTCHFRIVPAAPSQRHAHVPPARIPLQIGKAQQRQSRLSCTQKLARPSHHQIAPRDLEAVAGFVNHFQALPRGLGQRSSNSSMQNSDRHRGRLGRAADAIARARSARHARSPLASHLERRRRLQSPSWRRARRARDARSAADFGFSHRRQLSVQQADTQSGSICVMRSNVSVAAATSITSPIRSAGIPNTTGSRTRHRPVPLHHFFAPARRNYLVTTGLAGAASRR